MRLLYVDLVPTSAINVHGLEFRVICPYCVIQG